ncbi:MAG: T9SS type A sorting domain-containing protein [Bacteroidia bacterium]
MKIKLYLTITLLLFISGFANAQFMCTDINPDSVVTLPAGPTAQATLNIDLNNDNTPDFQLTSAQSGTIGFILAQTGTPWANNFTLVDGSNNLQALNAGDPIGGSSTVWHQMNTSNPAITTIIGSFATGTWAGQNDKYIGLALTVATNTYYGWARMSVSGSANSYTLKEYGYNSVPGASIAAGQACTTNTFPITVSVQPTVCQGDSVIVTAYTGSVVASSYTWSSNPAGAIFVSPNSSVTSVTFTNSGTYTLNVAATAGSLTGSGSQTIQVNPKPVIAVFSSSNIICAGSSAILTASSAATSFTWNTTATTQTISVSPTVTTTYTVIAALNGCTNSATFTQSVTTCTGVHSMENTLDIIGVYPNPASDKLTIQLNQNQPTVNIKLYSVLGELIDSKEISVVYQEAVYNLENVSNGVYFIEVGDTGSLKRIKLIVNSNNK